MVFPYPFTTNTTNRDFTSKLIDFVGNSAILTVAATLIAAVSKIAFKALKFENVVHIITKYTPVALTTRNIGSITGGGLCVAGLCIAVAKALGKRQ